MKNKTKFKCVQGKKRNNQNNKVSLGSQSVDHILLTDASLQHTAEASLINSS